TMPSTWLEALVKTYVGDALAADLYLEIADGLPDEVADVVRAALAETGHSQFVVAEAVVYSVSGSKQLLDLVNVVYTDAHGVPQTEFNVSLPWSKVVVLEPGVQTESVVATSFYGRLSCSIFNAAGQRVVASANASNMATCAR
ncbi:ferritin-like fold-containing protein, partial [Mycobacterium avium]|uniref:ferritin-like fold-containing protein n=1 Tax=Mycobacterium avium TaxID=1764 RepID=UPI000A95D9DD